MRHVLPLLKAPIRIVRVRGAAYDTGRGRVRKLRTRRPASRLADRGRGRVASIEAAAMPNLGPQELFILLLIVLVLFGGKNIPNLAKSLGSGIREFKRAVNGHVEDEKPGTSDTP